MTTSLRMRNFFSTKITSPPSSRLYQGFVKPYQTDVSCIDDNPLLELKQASTKQGIADVNGYRLTGAPWAFSLAEISVRDGRPMVRTIGFQRVSEEGLDWLTPRKKHKNNENDAVALCYTMGTYPPPSGETCEQWRAEGKPFEIPISEVLDTAPIGSFAQILAVGRQKKEKSVDANNRAILDDKEMFLEQVEQVKKELQAGTIDMKEMESSVKVVRLIPDRMELMISGPIWDRFQWTREGDNWSPKAQLMPY